MPFEADIERIRPLRIEVRPSAVQELTWVLNLVEWGQPSADLPELAEAAPQLREELDALWGDAEPSLPDASILAERIGALLTDEADSFLDGLERAALLEGGGLELLSESSEVREATLARLELLRGDQALVRRYAALLRRTWELARPLWEQTGREVVRRATTAWTERLRQGARIVDLFPTTHPLRHEHLEELTARRQRIVVSPLYFAAIGGFVVDMTTYLHIGGPARTADAMLLRRKESEAIAADLKVLADGTRVALLRELAAEPSSVTDLARRFGLAQPTVSNHVRLLRDAGLLEARKDGARVVYTVPVQRLERLLERTRHILIDHC